jgi:transposase
MAPTTPKPNYSPHTRTRVVMLRNCGLPLYRIAHSEGISPGSIHGIIRRYRDQKSAQDLPRLGRPAALTDREKRIIFRCINLDPFASISQIRLSCNLQCANVTLTRFLKKNGIQHTYALRRPKLTPELAQKRLEFARKHINKPETEWQRWIFSDETTIARGQGEKQKWVFCRSVRYDALTFV